MGTLSTSRERRVYKVSTGTLSTSRERRVPHAGHLEHGVPSHSRVGPTGCIFIY